MQGAEVQYLNEMIEDGEKKGRYDAHTMQWEKKEK